MNAFQAALSPTALDFLAGFDERTAVDAGVAPTQIRAWKQLHSIYFAETHSRQKQRLAFEKARRGGFSVDQLAMFERRLKTIKSARERAKLRLLLLDATGAYRALERIARKLIPTVKKSPQQKATFSRSRAGMRTMTLTAPERDLADLEHAASQDLDPTRPATPQMAKTVLELMRGGGVAKAVPRPLLLISLPKLTKILRQEGDETILGLSDGTTITGAEFLHQYADLPLEAALFHPQEGPVNLYRSQRLANSKQRDLARATSTVCPVPGCKCPADRAEIHHVVAWKDGGETNMSNLVVLCRYHNRMNEVPGRGRIELVDGLPIWTSPRGYRVPNDYHPYGARVE